MALSITKLEYDHVNEIYLLESNRTVKTRIKKNLKI